MEPTSCEQLCFEHLSNTTTYQIVENYNVNQTFGKLRLILTKHNVMYTTKRDHNGNQLKSKLAKSLLQFQNNDKLRPCYFYVLPKLHKLKLSSRPIVDNVNSVTYCASKFLHNHLVSTMDYLTTVVKSTRHALQRMLKYRPPPSSVTSLT